MHALKIDQSFIAKLDESSYSHQLVHTIMQLATALKLETVAEGVETASQLESLVQEHCAAAQDICSPDRWTWAPRPTY